MWICSNTATRKGVSNSPVGHTASFLMEKKQHSPEGNTKYQSIQRIFFSKTKLTFDRFILYLYCFSSVVLSLLKFKGNKLLWSTSSRVLNLIFLGGCM